MPKRSHRTPEQQAKDTAAVAEWRKNNPEKYARVILRYNLSKHNLTIEEYEAMVVAQNGVCAICHETEISRQRLSVDHDHKTNKVRALGYAKDSVERLLAAVDYLKRHSNG